MVAELYIVCQRHLLCGGELCLGEELEMMDIYALLQCFFCGIDSHQCAGGRVYGDEIAVGIESVET